MVKNKPFTIVGVLEERVDGLNRPVGLWLPLSALASNGPVMAGGVAGQTTGNCCIEMVARLSKDTDIARARTELQVLHDQFAAGTRRRSGVVEVYGTASIAGPNADLDLFGMVAAAVGLVLLLACANVGNLQLARGLARRREIATRLSIGASRARVVRQLLVESLVLSLLAGVISVAIAAAVPGLLLRLLGDEVEPDMAGRFLPDSTVVMFTLLVCAAASLAFALAPALHATRRTIPLGSLDRSSTRHARFTLRGGLLAVQIAVSTVLLIGAGLLTRAVVHAMTFDPGFAIGEITRVLVSLPSETPAATQQSFTMRLLADLERDPQARIALSSNGPMSPAGFYIMNVVLPNESLLESRAIERRSVSARYFDVLGIPVLEGRTFTSSSSVGELVVNESFARAIWRDGSPVGRSVREVDSKGTLLRSHTIVGVVRDAWLSGLDRIRPMVFRPAVSGVFVMRGGAAEIERIRVAASGLTGEAHLNAWPLRRDLEENLEGSRTGAAAAWGIGILALLLASVGVFGVFAYGVEERRREIGVRMALGAARAQIVGMLIATSGRAMLFGLGAGLLASLAAGPVLDSYLYGLNPLDPLAYTGVVLLLATAAMLATFVPARRACRVDPAVTLRDEG
jgi:predicted permease